MIALGLKLAAALAHLHAHGLVHRDVKPSNILFIGGEPKLADAGLVAAVDDARSLVGTAGYIAPEGPGTPQADLYALGKVLYEAAFGKDRQEFPALPADVASRPDHARLLELNAVLLKACAADSRERYQSADHIRSDLELLRAGCSVKRRQAWQRGLKLAARLSLIAVVAFALCWLLLSRFKGSTFHPLNLPQPAATIAVLPFDDENPMATGNDLSGDLTEQIRSGLTRVPALGVMGKSSSAAFKISPDRLAAARSNKVSAVLEGRVRRTGETVRLSLELSDTRSGRLLWSDALEAPATDPFALQLAVLQRVPDALGIPLTDTQRTSIANWPTQNLAAQRLYWEAKALNRLGNATASESAIQNLTKATALDPNFALAYCELADTYSGLAEFGDRLPKEFWAPARAAAQRAVELAPDASETHVAMAGVLEAFAYDWSWAEKEFRRAVELNPNNAKARLWFGLFLSQAGRLDEARPHRERALALDPFGSLTAVRWNKMIRPCARA